MKKYLSTILLVAVGAATIYNTFEIKQLAQTVETQKTALENEIVRIETAFKAKEEQNQALISSYEEALQEVKSEFKNTLEESLKTVQDKSKIGNQINESVDKMADSVKKKASSILKDLSDMMDDSAKEEVVK